MKKLTKYSSSGIDANLTYVKCTNFKVFLIDLLIKSPKKLSSILENYKNN